MYTHTIFLIYSQNSYFIHNSCKQSWCKNAWYVVLTFAFLSFLFFFIYSWPILEIFFNLKTFICAHRMATSELISWSWISTYFSLSLMQYECLFNIYSQHHILMVSYHNYTTLSGFHSLTHIHHIHLLSYYYI